MAQSRLLGSQAASSLIHADELLSGSEPPDVIERAIRAGRAAERWLFGDRMQELIAVFGAELDRISEDSSSRERDWLHLSEELPAWTGDVLDQAASLPRRAGPAVEALRRAICIERWAATRFNFRSQDGATYRERNQAVRGNLDDAVRAAVPIHAAELGLVRGTRPHHTAYDGTLVLGGGWRSPLLRARYAAQCERAGVSLGTPYFLGSPRLLLTDPPERELTDSYAPDAVDEFDLIIAGATREFNLQVDKVMFVCGCTSMDQICPNWEYRHLDAAGVTPPRYTHRRSGSLVDACGQAHGIVLSASTSRPPYRPDTSDTLALWASEVNPPARQRVLVVTTQVFVPFQTFDSIKRLYLHHAVDVDVVGYSTDWDDRPQTPEYLLQETLSAIRSARRLLIEAVAILVGA